MASSEDTEITLGTGKMLALFFGLVLVCSVFFGLGFSLGRNSVKVSAAELPTPSGVTAAAHTPAVKPTTANPATDLTFYKTVGQKEPDAPSTGAENSTPAAEAAPAPAAAEQKAPSPDPTAAPIANGYLVQVAAVSKQEDAEALVDALKKKQYAAFSSNNSPADKLFHVQVGPFADIKDAEAMRAKLVSDGYNPIVKR
jgi:DedD protein